MHFFCPSFQGMHSEKSASEDYFSKYNNYQEAFDANKPEVNYRLIVPFRWLVILVQLLVFAFVPFPLQALSKQ